MYARRLATCFVFSVVGHLVFARGMMRLPPRREPPRPVTVSVRVVEPPPPPSAPARPPEPAPAKTPLHEAPRPEPARRPALAAVVREGPAHEAPPSERAVTTGDATDQPVFGISMESTSEAGTGPSLPVGNTLQAPTARRPAAERPLAAPVAPYEVTKMPLPKGRCTGHYTEEARESGVEGTVELDLVVGEDGVPRDVTVVHGLGNGLTEAAIAAVTACRFTPGERGGVPVPVRVRGFKIRFFLQDE